MTFNYLRFWIRIAAVFLFRSGRSTIVLSLMVIVAVATLIFLSALAMGVNDAMILNSVGLYSGHISGIALPSSIKPERLQVNGTTSVLKRIVFSGAFVHQNRIQSVNLIGIDPSAEKKNTAIWKKTIDGRYPRNNENAVFLSQTLAERLSVQSGSSLMFRPELSDTPIELTISGVYQTGIDFFDQGVAFCPYTAIPRKADTWLAAKALSRFQRHSVGFIFQHGNLLSYLSVFENIAFPLTLNGIGGNQQTERVEVLLEKIGLRGAAKAMPHELSGGEIQRVSAARALAHSPRMLLADEPTASLDSETGKNLVDLMVEIGREQGCTLIISTHDPEVCDLADRTIQLRDGERI